MRAGSTRAHKHKHKHTRAGASERERVRVGGAHCAASIVSSPSLDLEACILALGRV